MRIGSLFSGIGGFDLAARWMGWETAWYSEVDPFCNAVMAHHFPEARALGDITRIDWRTVERPDLVCGGFPCQPHSVAGKRAGSADSRDLWGEFARAIRDLRPHYVVAENVPGLFTSDGGRFFNRVLSDLASLGYDAEWQVLSAADVGAPHRRERVWIVAQSGRKGRKRGGIRGGETAAGEMGNAGPTNGSEAVPGGSALANAPEEPQRRGPDRSSIGSDVPDAEKYAGRECNGDGAAGWEFWAVEPALGRVVDGFSTELAFIRRVIGDQGSYQTAESETQRLVHRILLEVWEHQELASTSPDLYRDRLRCLVRGVSRERAQEGWLVGKRLKEDKELRGLWERVCTAPFEETRDLLPALLERIGKTKRPKTMASRVAQLRALGNAIVPACAFEIFKGIEATRC